MRSLGLFFVVICSFFFFGCDEPKEVESRNCKVSIVEERVFYTNERVITIKKHKKHWHIAGKKWIISNSDYHDIKGFLLSDADWRVEGQVNDGTSGVEVLEYMWILDNWDKKKIPAVVKVNGWVIDRLMPIKLHLYVKECPFFPKYYYVPNDGTDPDNPYNPEDANTWGKYYEYPKDSPVYKW